MTGADADDVAELPRRDPSADLAQSLLSGARHNAVAAGAVRQAPGTTTRASGRRRRPPEQRTGPGPDAGDPQLLADSVEELVGDRGWQLPVAVGGVLGRWGQVVGPEVAAHCAPESYDDGVVTVRAESTAWATQLRLLAPSLVRRLNEELGDGTVRMVEVKGPSGPSWRRGRLRVPGRGPRDTYG